MNIHYELSKIRSGFSKVKDDMEFLASKITHNYDDFMKKHESLSKEIKKHSKELKKHVEELKQKDFKYDYTEKEFLDLKHQVKELKEELEVIQKNHFNVVATIEDVKKNKESMRNFQEKFKSSELEIYLLKERLSEKDTEIKQIKEVNKHMFHILEDLAKVEVEMISQRKSK